MIGIDTNILIYARFEGNPWHEPAKAFLESLANNPDVVIAEFVLVELYLAIRNPAIVADPLSAAEAAEAAEECQWFRKHPRWALAENAWEEDDMGKC
jgi:predicted nucleic acid-binding protein